ncbi:hypothetical protein BGW42_007578 [Actinomortierella wolfii]|nr:hypothetical protein BGW42_007578 [Actinomortierella wolfii]
MKRRSLKRSNSSRTSIHQQSKANSPSASPTPPTAHIVIGRRLVARPSPSTSSLSTCSDDHNDPPTPPSPIDENHRRFLKEAFCNVPMMEIDRKIKDANWDFNEAAAMLAQEDYTWQSVPRRRSIHK